MLTPSPAHVLCCLFGFSLLAGTVCAQQGPATSANFEVSAVDIDGNPLPALKAGEYARLRVRANLQDIPDAALGRVTASAVFKTTVLGRPVSYSIKLPLRALAGSAVDPSIGSPTSGQKLGKEVENQSVTEILDFYIPKETPVGELTINVQAAVTSAVKLSRKIRLPVVR